MIDGCSIGLSHKISNCTAVIAERIFPCLCFVPFQKFSLSNLFVVPQQHYFLQGGEEMMKSLECIVILFFFELIQSVENIEGRKKEEKKRFPQKMFCVINTNGGCQI